MVRSLRASSSTVSALPSDRGREAALRPDAQALELDHGRRLAHARLELVLGLGPRALRRHEAEDHLLVVGHERERVEAARALVVVLEQQPLGVDAAEDRPGDRLVAARDEPARVLVAAAQVEAEGHARRGVDHRVVELDAVRQPALGRPAAGLVERAPRRVDEERVVRRVDLEVRRAEAGELADLVDEDRDDVLHERVERRVGAGRALGVQRLPNRVGLGSVILATRSVCARRKVNSSAASERRRRSLSTTAMSGGRSTVLSPSSSECHAPHSQASIVTPSKPSTAATSSDWNDSRRNSPSVTTSKPGVLLEARRRRGRRGPRSP